MKTNHTSRRLSALILAGSIAVLTAAADTTDTPAVKHRRAATTASAARKSAAPANTESERIYDLRRRDSIRNPAYHEPAGAMEGTRRPNREAEPDRVFDAETGNFEPNPVFQTRW